MISAKRPVVLALKAITIFFIFFYLPSCFVYVVSPRAWWLMGIFSIGFAYLWLLLLLLVITWLFYNRKTALLLLVLLIAGLPVMKNVFALNFPRSFRVENPENQLRIMQWNCNGLMGEYPNSPQTAERAKAVAFIKKYNPDVICTQDFADTRREGVNSNISLLRDTLGYPYFVYKQHYSSAYPGYSNGIGIAIFSRFPLVDSGKLFYPGKVHPETIIWADVLANNRLTRVATTHFQSMHLSRDTRFPLEPELSQDSSIIMQGNKIDKLKYFQPYHVTEARFLRRFLDSCKTPLIFTGDLNSNPSSFVYHTVKGQLKDAHLEKGFGFGRTYDSWQPALRIDYIFHSEAIINEQTSLFRTTFSDHDPVIMDFSTR